MIRNKLILLTLVFGTFAFGFSALAQNSTGEPGRGSSEANPLKNVYFGEQHRHTKNSPDAFVRT